MSSSLQDLYPFLSTPLEVKPEGAASEFSLRDIEVLRQEAFAAVKRYDDFCEDPNYQGTQWSRHRVELGHAASVKLSALKSALGGVLPVE